MSRRANHFRCARHDVVDDGILGLDEENFSLAAHSLASPHFEPAGHAVGIFDHAERAIEIPAAEPLECYDAPDAPVA